MASLSVSAVSLRTTNALLSWPGAMSRTVIPPPCPRVFLEGGGVGGAVAGRLGLVVVAEPRADVLGHEVDLTAFEGGLARLAGAELELAIHLVAGLLEDLRVDLGHEDRLIEVVGPILIGALTPALDGDASEDAADVAADVAAVVAAGELLDPLPSSRR